jgi:hypothetical protein
MARCPWLAVRRIMHLLGVRQRGTGRNSDARRPFLAPFPLLVDMPAHLLRPSLSAQFLYQPNERRFIAGGRGHFRPAFRVVEPANPKHDRPRVEGPMNVLTKHRRPRAEGRHSSPCGCVGEAPRLHSHREAMQGRQGVATLFGAESPGLERQLSGLRIESNSSVSSRRDGDP